MATQIIIRIASEVKGRFSKLSRLEGKTPSQTLREPIEDYIKERGIRTYIDAPWNRIGAKLGSKNLKQRDINTVIKEARKARG